MPPPGAGPSLGQKLEEAAFGKRHYLDTLMWALTGVYGALLLFTLLAVWLPILHWKSM